MLNETDAAKYIGMSVHYLRKDRCSGAIGNRKPGPRYMKVGRSVRYNVIDLDSWVNSCVAPRHAERRQAIR